jgi:hypothetical protein
MIVFQVWVLGLGRVLETGAEDPSVGLIGHGSAGDVAENAIEVAGNVVGREAREHEAHEGLGVGGELGVFAGGVLIFQILMELLGSVVVFLRYLIGKRDGDVHHSFIS